MTDLTKTRRKELTRQIDRIDKSIELREAVIKDQRALRQRLVDELEGLPKR